jgi:hypothetical protein
MPYVSVLLGRTVESEQCRLRGEHLRQAPNIRGYTYSTISQERYKPRERYLNMKVASGSLSSFWTLKV